MYHYRQIRTENEGKGRYSGFVGGRHASGLNCRRAGWFVLGRHGSGLHGHGNERINDGANNHYSSERGRDLERQEFSNQTSNTSLVT